MISRFYYWFIFILSLFYFSKKEILNLDRENENYKFSSYNRNKYEGKTKIAERENFKKFRENEILRLFSPLDTRTF
jgi:hypothetical protein